MGAEIIIIGEIMAALLSFFAERLKAAGVSADKIEGMLLEATDKALKTKPEDLPDV